MYPLDYLLRQPSNFIHTMRHIVITLLAVLSAMPFAYGQATENTLSNSLPAKWEIGIDLLPLIKMNHLPQNTLFFRRNYAINNHTSKAFRFRVGVDAEDKYVKTSFGNDVLWDSRTYSPYLALGHEWKFLHNKYRWYVGAEVSGQLKHTNIALLDFSPFGSAVFEDQKIRNQYITGNGIFGLQYFIANKLSISVESSLEIRYIHEKLVTEGRGSDGTLVSYGGEDWTVVTSKIMPIFSFNINYSLQKRQNNAKK